MKRIALVVATAGLAATACGGSSTDAATQTCHRLIAQSEHFAREFVKPFPHGVAVKQYPVLVAADLKTRALKAHVRCVVTTPPTLAP